MSEIKKDKIATIILYVICIFIVSLLLLLVGIVLFRGLRYLDFNFLFGKSKSSAAGGGIGPQIFNSFYLLIITLLITIPIGVGAGIYLAEYAKEGKILNAIRLCIDTMASLPSIVVGLFGLIFFVQTFQWGYSILAGALSLTIINIPSLTRVTENAIKENSKRLKEGSLALGATKWQTIKKVTFPSSISQIITGIILAAGRIFGEAAVLIYTAGMNAKALNFSNVSLVAKNSPFSLFRSAETIAVYIWQVNSEGMVRDANRMADGSSCVLIIMVLLFNFLARFLGRKIQEAYGGKK